MDLTQRVAFRYEKRAGIFEAPPVMLEAITKWFSKVYAGQVLAKVEEKLKDIRSEENVFERHIKEMKQSLASVERDVKGLGTSNKTIRYRLWHLGNTEFYIGVRWDKNTYYDPENRKGVYTTVIPAIGGKPQPNYVPVYEVGQSPKGAKKIDFLYNYGAPGQKGTAEDVTEYIKTSMEIAIGLAIERAERVGPKKKEKFSPAIVELKLLEKECKKYTSSGKGYKSRAQKNFPMDLTGWKYLSDIKQRYPSISDVNKFLKDKGWDEINVILNFAPYKKSLGTWYPYKREIRVDVRQTFDLKTNRMFGGMPKWVKVFKDGLYEALEALRHELQHVGQDVFTHLMGLESEAGTPAKELTQYKRPPKGRKPHPLREEEFYTRLADEINKFIDYTKRRDPKKLRSIFDDWITSYSAFFTALKRHEPAKWRKAVGEFVKGLDAAGVEIPGADKNA